MSGSNDVALDGQNAATRAHSAASLLLAAANIWSGEPASQPPEPVSHTIEPPKAAAEPPKPAATISVAAEIKPAVQIIPLSSDDSTERPASIESPAWQPRKLSLALQGGGTFAAFTWGVLERLLEEPDLAFDAISGASAGAVNAVLLASGLAEGGRERARARLDRFWQRVMQEASFRSLMLLGAFSPAGTSVAFGPTLRSGQFDPFDLDPLRRALARDINFPALLEPDCPKLLLAATRIRDGHLRAFANHEITPDVLLASTCPPLVHCAVEIDGEAHWDGGYGGNPPLIQLVQQSQARDLLVVQVTPSRDSYVPITLAAIDRRLDQIMANSALNAELAALEWARGTAAPSLRLSRIAAEDEVDGLAQRSATDLGRGFITQLHRSGRSAADRWLRQGEVGRPPRLTRQDVQTEAGVLRPVAEPALV